MGRKALCMIVGLMSICLIMSGCFRQLPNPDLVSASDSEENDLEITASNVDNTANNRAAHQWGLVTQLGDKLYVSADNVDQYLLCEISTGTTRILRAEDNSDYNSIMWSTDTVFTYDGKLCLPISDFVKSKISDRHIDLESGKTVTEQTVYFEGAGFWYPIVSDGVLYYSDYNTLCSYEDGENRTLATAEALGLSEGQLGEELYIGGGCVYYSREDDHTLYLDRYDFSKNEITGSVRVTESVEDANFWEIIADGDDAYCIDNNKLYHVDFAQNTCEVVFTCDYEYGMVFNYYDKKLYIGLSYINDHTEPGLYMIDTSTSDQKAEQLLKNDGVEEIYIFDDEYVYYSVEYDSLSRLRLNDRTTELVFDYNGSLIGTKNSEMFDSDYLDYA